MILYRDLRKGKLQNVSGIFSSWSLQHCLGSLAGIMLIIS